MKRQRGNTETGEVRRPEQLHLSWPCLYTDAGGFLHAQMQGA